VATLWEDILNDVRTLVEHHAHGARREVHVSPEMVKWLKSTSQRQTAPSTVAPAAAAVPENLEGLASEVAGCTKCGLCSTRTQTVFGAGDPNASLVFVGEAPGEEEDKRGEPFVGRAGQLLTDIIEKGMNLRRGEVYICNVLKCRPPGNRNPAADEMRECEPFLVRQLALVRPQVICALGGFAAKQLLKTEDGVGALRGRWHRYEGIPVRVTYHPSYLLRLEGERQIAEKRKVWEDIKAIQRALKGEETP